MIICKRPKRAPGAEEIMWFYEGQNNRREKLHEEQLHELYFS
jgi:hypothetical protein